MAELSENLKFPFRGVEGLRAREPKDLQGAEPSRVTEVFRQKDPAFQRRGKLVKDLVTAVNWRPDILNHGRATSCLRKERWSLEGKPERGGG